MKSRVAAIVPALNEAVSIAAVVRGLADAVSAVVVCDDGSRDGTAEAARAAGARVTVQPQTGGTGRSKLRPIRDTTRTCFRAVFYRYIESS